VASTLNNGLPERIGRVVHRAAGAGEALVDVDASRLDPEGERVALDREVKRCPAQAMGVPWCT
jgi:hypothetical protein